MKMCVAACFIQIYFFGGGRLCALVLSLYYNYDSIVKMVS